MVKIQVIGLPGAGKTTAIERFLEIYKPHNVTYLDIRTVYEPNKESKFKKLIEQSKDNVIAESATGVWLANTITVHLDPPIETIYKNLKTRGSNVDPDYLSLLAGQIYTPNYRIIRAEEIPLLLFNLLGG